MHNTRIKRFPDGSCEILVASRQVFREPGWEEASKPRKSRSGSEDSVPASGPGWLDEETEYILDEERGKAVENSPVSESGADRARRRARSAVRDIARANKFTYFVTLTLDPEKIDRHDVEEITRKLNAWLSNQVQRRGLCYVLVPERHKDGAVHFHGLFNEALPVKFSGVKQKGRKVFNLPSWTLGFTTAIRLYGKYEKAVSYVCKYIGKQSEKIGGRWYYSGGALHRPVVEYTDSDFDAAVGMDGAYQFEVSGLGVSYVLLRVDGGEGGV